MRDDLRAESTEESFNGFLPTKAVKEPRAAKSATSFHFIHHTILYTRKVWIHVNEACN